MNSLKRTAHYRANYRRFNFGRRENDRNKPGLFICPVISADDVKEVAKQIVLAMDSSLELKEAILSELQFNSFCVMSFDKEGNIR